MDVTRSLPQTSSRSSEYSRIVPGITGRRKWVARGIIPSLLLFTVAALPSIGSAQSPPTGPTRIQYISPINGATSVTRETSIIFRQGDYIVPTSVNSGLFSVTGSISGKHYGSAVLSSDRKTITFKPFQIFTYNEKVTVEVKRGFKTTTGIVIDPFSFSFKIAAPKKGITAMTVVPIEGGGTEAEAVAERPVEVLDSKSAESPTVTSEAAAMVGAVDATEAAQAKRASGTEATPESNAIKLHLSEAYPNPFSSMTELQVTLDASALISLRVYDAGGHEVAVLGEGIYPQGEHPFAFDGSRLPSGLYHCILRVGDQMATRRLIVSR